MLFQDYARSAGVKLLYEDVAFIRKCLNGINRTSRVTIMRDYIQIWLTAMNEKCSQTAECWQESGK
jgi:hypothetical protein